MWFAASFYATNAVYMLALCLGHGAFVLAVHYDVMTITKIASRQAVNPDALSALIEAFPALKLPAKRIALNIARTNINAIHISVLLGSGSLSIERK